MVDVNDACLFNQMIIFLESGDKVPLFTKHYIILQSVELTSEAVEFLNGIFRLLDTDKVCITFLDYLDNHYYVL